MSSPRVVLDQHSKMPNRVAKLLSQVLPLTNSSGRFLKHTLLLGNIASWLQTAVCSSHLEIQAPALKGWRFSGPFMCDLAPRNTLGPAPTEEQTRGFGFVSHTRGAEDISIAYARLMLYAWYSAVASVSIWNQSASTTLRSLFAVLSPNLLSLLSFYILSQQSRLFTYVHLVAKFLRCLSLSHPEPNQVEPVVFCCYFLRCAR